jgi:hypothetical protein
MDFKVRLIKLTKKIAFLPILQKNDRKIQLNSLQMTPTFSPIKESLHPRMKTQKIRPYIENKVPILIEIRLN